MTSPTPEEVSRIILAVVEAAGSFSAAARAAELDKANLVRWRHGKHAPSGYRWAAAVQAWREAGFLAAK